MKKALKSAILPLLIVLKLGYGQDSTFFPTNSTDHWSYASISNPSGFVFSYLIEVDSTEILDSLRVRRKIHYSNSDSTKFDTCKILTHYYLCSTDQAPNPNLSNNEDIYSGMRDSLILFEYNGKEYLKWSNYYIYRGQGFWLKKIYEKGIGVVYWDKKPSPFYEESWILKSHNGINFDSTAIVNLILYSQSRTVKNSQSLMVTNRVRKKITTNPEMLFNLLGQKMEISNHLSTRSIKVSNRK